MQSLHLRKLSNATYAQFTEAAGARGYTQVEYLVALLKLHDGVRNILDEKESRRGGLEDLRKLVDELRLGSVVR